MIHQFKIFPDFTNNTILDLISVLDLISARSLAIILILILATVSCSST